MESGRMKRGTCKALWVAAHCGPGRSGWRENMLKAQVRDRASSPNCEGARFGAIDCTRDERVDFVVDSRRAQLVRKPWSVCDCATSKGETRRERGQIKQQNSTNPTAFQSGKTLIIFMSVIFNMILLSLVRLCSFRKGSGYILRLSIVSLIHTAAVLPPGRVSKNRSPPPPLQNARKLMR
jgi:hypothetical protein